MKSLLRYQAVLLGTAALLSPLALAQPRPSVDTFKQAMVQRLMKIKLDGFSERNVRFVAVQAGSSKNGAYAFTATLWVRDYEPGYPRNRYYGRTCIGKLEDKVYWMSPDDAGGWKVEGNMTPDSDKSCKPNPGEGVTSIPVESLPGTAASGGARTPPAASGNAGGAIAMGEWACYGAGGRALMGLGFKVTSSNTYTDLDGGNRGTYSVRGGTLAFNGGHLAGQVGRAIGGGKFNIGTTTCEPNR